MPDEISDKALTENEKDIMRLDQEQIFSFKTYRRRYEHQMLRGAQVWNMVADPSPRDDISNIFIGIARMIGTQSVAAMTEGRPGFGFRPGSKGDVPKIPLWQAGIDHIMDLSNYDAKQLYFFTDFTALGYGIIECVPQLPMRKVRFPNEGGFEEVWKRDWRKPKFEIRHRSPFEIWLDPSAPNLDEVHRVYDEQYITVREFDAQYHNAVLPDGKKKYKNTKLVKPGKLLAFSDNDQLMYRDEERKDRIIIGTWQDEDNDVHRKYANGVLILDGPLQIKEDADGNRTSGMNALGVHSFCFGPNEHQYDSNFRTHSLYSMGLPFAMRGFDALYQALTNMTIDNIRLENTVAISYKANDGMSQLDLDSRDFYSGDFIDGEIGVHPFGKSNLGISQVMWDQLDQWCIYLTGVNFKQLSGDPARTAFELSQRIRAQNRRFEHKLKVLENGCFKKLGKLLLSGVMSELTVGDWEDITDKERDIFTQQIADNEISGDDFKTVAGKLTKRRSFTMLRVKGRDMEEALPSSGVRKIDPDSIDSTLIDRGRADIDSFIIAAPEYVWSIEYAERGGVPDVYVRSARMLGDDQDLRFAKINAAINLARARKAEDPEGTKFDLAKMEKEYIETIDIPTEDVFKEASEETAVLDMVRQAQQQAQGEGGGTAAPVNEDIQLKNAPDIQQVENPQNILPTPL